MNLETDFMIYLATHINFAGAKLVIDGTTSRTLNGSRTAGDHGFLAGRGTR